MYNHVEHVSSLLKKVLLLSLVVLLCALAHILVAHEQLYEKFVQVKPKLYITNVGGTVNISLVLTNPTNETQIVQLRIVAVNDSNIIVANTTTIQILAPGQQVNITVPLEVNVKTAASCYALAEIYNASLGIPIPVDVDYCGEIISVENTTTDILQVQIGNVSVIVALVEHPIGYSVQDLIAALNKTIHTYVQVYGLKLAPPCVSESYIVYTAPSEEWWGVTVPELIGNISVHEIPELRPVPKYVNICICHVGINTLIPCIPCLNETVGHEFFHVAQLAYIHSLSYFNLSAFWTIEGGAVAASPWFIWHWVKYNGYNADLLVTAPRYFGKKPFDFIFWYGNLTLYTLDPAYAPYYVYSLVYERCLAAGLPENQCSVIAFDAAYYVTYHYSPLMWSVFAIYGLRDELMRKIYGVANPNYAPEVAKMIEEAYVNMSGGLAIWRFVPEMRNLLTPYFNVTTGNITFAMQPRTAQYFILNLKPGWYKIRLYTTANVSLWLVGSVKKIENNTVVWLEPGAKLVVTRSFENGVKAGNLSEVKLETIRVYPVIKVFRVEAPARAYGAFIVRVNVSNIGEAPGTANLTLVCNKSKYVQLVHLAPHESKIVSFVVTILRTGYYVCTLYLNGTEVWTGKIYGEPIRRIVVKPIPPVVTRTISYGAKVGSHEIEYVVLPGLPLGFVRNVILKIDNKARLEIQRGTLLLVEGRPVQTFTIKIIQVNTTMPGARIDYAIRIDIEPANVVLSKFAKLKLRGRGQVLALVNGSWTILPAFTEGDYVVAPIYRPGVYAVGRLLRTNVAEILIEKPDVVTAGEKFTIRVRVLDAAGKPLPGKAVIVYVNNMFVTYMFTDARGVAKIPLVLRDVGPCLVKISVDNITKTTTILVRPVT